MPKGPDKMPATASTGISTHFSVGALFPKRLGNVRVTPDQYPLKGSDS